MYKKRYVAPLLLVLLTGSKLLSNVYDNRFFPLFKRPYTKKDDKYSRFGTSFFAMSADSAMGDHDEELRIPRLFGVCGRDEKLYNLDRIGKGLVLLGKTNPIRQDLQDQELPWTIDQKISAQGMSFVYDQHIWKYLYAGASLFFMKVHSNFAFTFDRPGNLSEDVFTGIYDMLCQSHNAIGVKGNNFNEFGMGDMDAYIRIGNVWERQYKMRRIDAGLSLGLLIPTGKETCLELPSSVPFGGNGHWGAYGQIDAEFGLKEDMKLLLMFRISKRAAKTKLRRLPIAKEHPLFGTLIAPAEVRPGLTIVFAPQFWWENLRKGFGLRAGLTLVYHDNDCWKDCRTAAEQEKVPSEVACLNEASRWASDYINLSAYYDFSDETDERRFAPIVSVTWDWPIHFFISKRTPKTHRVSLGLDVLF